MGETVSRKSIRRIIQLAQDDEAVIKVLKHFSMYMAPQEILLHLNAPYLKITSPRTRSPTPLSGSQVKSKRNFQE